MIALFYPSGSVCWERSIKISHIRLFEQASSSIGITYQKPNAKTFYLDLILQSRAGKCPATLFTVIDFHKNALRINHQIVLYRWMGLIVEQLLASINIFGTWREHLNNHRWIMELFILWLLIAWVAGNGDIRIDIARLRKLELHI